MKLIRSFELTSLDDSVSALFVNVSLESNDNDGSEKHDLERWRRSMLPRVKLE